MAICCNRRGLWTEHPHTSPFLVFARMFNDVSHDIGSSVCARHTIHVSCAWLSVWSLFDPLFALITCLSHLLLHPPDPSSSMWIGSEQDLLCKAEAKPRRLSTACLFSRTVHILERKWIFYWTRGARHGKTEAQQRYCWQLQNHVWITNFRGEELKNYHARENLCRISSWSYDMEGHAKKCVERYCELANKTTQQLYKLSTPCIDDHHFKEELKSVGELSQVCCQIVLKCLYLARVGRPDILWSVNKLARSITKWTKACDKRLCRLISYIHHTCEYKQYCHVENTVKKMQNGTISRLRFCRRSWGFKIYFRWSIVRFRKPYVCSDMLDVQETNFSFAQLNRIRNHFLGCRIEVGWYPRTWFKGSDRRSSWTHEPES